MEETATNIYFASPLQGLLNVDAFNNAPPTAGISPNTIWITGEFFGVQRARDMLFQISATKVCVLSERCGGSRDTDKIDPRLKQ
jgi:hypothetical protein